MTPTAPPDAAALRDAWVRKYAREPAPWRGGARLPPAAMAALAALRPEARVLEVGAGGGKTLAAARGRAPHTVALDWVAPPRPDARWVLADAARLPFADRAFDIVLLLHVLGHEPALRRAAVAREAWRVAAAGGLVCVEAFARGDLRDGKGEPAGEAASVVRDGGILYHYFEEDEFARLFPSEGDVRLVRDERRHLGERVMRARWQGAWRVP